MYVLTKHARERAREFGLSESEAYEALKRSEKRWLTKGERRHKAKKWGEDQDGVFYRQYNSLLFTVKYKSDPIRGSTILLVLTITDMNINLRH